MTQEIVITALSSSLIWVIIFLIFISKQRLKNVEILKNKEIRFEKEKNQILEQVRTEKQDEFEKAYQPGMEARKRPYVGS